MITEPQILDRLSTIDQYNLERLITHLPYQGAYLNIVQPSSKKTSLRIEASRGGLSSSARIRMLAQIKNSQDEGVVSFGTRVLKEGAWMRWVVEGCCAAQAGVSNAESQGRVERCAQ